MELIAPLCYVLAFTFVVHKWKFFHLEGIPRQWTTSAFLIKIATSFFFFLVYTRYYTDTSESDALRYFDDALLIRQQWNENRDVFWSFMVGRKMDDPAYAEVYNQLIAWSSGYRYGLSNDCSTIIRINVLLSFISFKNFHVHAIILSFMAFAGFTALYKSVVSFLTHRKKLLFVACFLLPSVLFWSSSVLKEAPLFMCLGFLIYHMMKLLDKPSNWMSWLLCVLCFALMIYLKSYVIISMTPGIIVLIISRVVRYRYPVWIFLGVHVASFLVAQQAHHFFRGGDFLYVLHKKQVDFYNVAFLRDAGSVVDIPPVSGTTDFLINYPHAFFLTYFRPHVFEAENTAYFLFALENTTYLILLFVSILFIRKRMQGLELSIILFVASFLLVLASILGNCVPILGAIVRYKVPAIPLMVIACLMIIDLERLKNFLRRVFRRQY